jgi:hypothetical protein
MGKCVIYIDVSGSVIQWESVSFIFMFLAERYNGKVCHLY